MLSNSNTFYYSREFLIDMRSDLPMGQLKISVNRYTASMQRDVYEECKGDDGIPYWFHRASGKTYWERPLLGDEESNALIVTAKGEESEKQLRIKEPMASPCGFYNVISAKHVATQFADYLPQAPNLPHTHIIGRVKPKSAVADWLTLGFDPWSAGKAPLSVQFVSNLATQAGKAFPREEAQERKVDVPLLLENPSADGYIRLGDKPGGDRARAVTSKAAVLAADFKKICSMARHGKFEEVENLMNQSDWELSINYADDQGRTLLHIVSQNGNKRLVKLCLRRGAAINSQTLTGQTSLHYAFGFGFVALGEYLISKGADDSLRNSSGLTCYEGLETKHLTYL